MSMKKRTMNDSRLGRTTNRQERSQHYVGNYLQRSESRYDEMVGEQHDGIQGKSWRSFKSNLKRKHFKPELSAKQNLRVTPNCPDERVLPEHWKYLVSYWASDKGKEISERNVKNRKKKKMNHVIGKKSFAQIIELEKRKMAGGAHTEDDDDIPVGDDEGDDELDYDISRVDLFEKFYTKDGNTLNTDIRTYLQNMRNSKSTGARDEMPNDIFAQVIGEDKCGRVRMFGNRTTESDMYGNKSGRGLGRRMNLEFETMKQKLQIQSKLIEKILRTSNQVESDYTQPVRTSSPSTSRNHMPSHRRQTLVLKVGAMVYLKSLSDNSKDVARGFILSLDSSKIVGREELGMNWCEVKINVAIEFSELLLRSLDNVKTIGEALGCSIAWPKYLIEVDR